jgi:hypothetical protein
MTACFAVSGRTRLQAVNIVIFYLFFLKNLRGNS